MLRSATVNRTYAATRRPCFSTPRNQDVRNAGQVGVAYVLPVVLIGAAAIGAVANLGQSVDATIVEPTSSALISSESSTPALANRSQAGVVKVLVDAAEVSKLVPDTQALTKMPTGFWKAMDGREVIVANSVLDDVRAVARSQGPDATGARAFLRTLEELLPEADQQGGLRLRTNANNGAIRVVQDPEGVQGASLEDKLLALAKAEKATLLSEDTISAVRAGLDGTSRMRLRELLEISPEGAVIDLDGAAQTLGDGLIKLPGGIELPTNTPIRIDGKLARTGLAADGTARLLPDDWAQLATQGLVPRNAEQAQLMAAFDDPNIRMISVAGRPGSGKTLMAMAYGLEKLLDKDAERVRVFRPQAAVNGEANGYVPGTLQDKLAVWAKPIVDALEVFPEGKRFKGFMDGNDPKIALESLEHLRGRSLKNTVIIIDEAQNYSVEALGTQLSRLDDGGEGGPLKVILVHDVFQRDSSAQAGRGLEFMLEGYRGRDDYFEILLPESQRGPIAQRAGELLERWHASGMAN